LDCLGDDKPKWDADMEYWLNDDLTVLDNQSYKSSFYENEVSGEIEE